MSPDMLDVARLVPMPPGITVDWVEANAAGMPFEKAQFDVVLCQFALMFMADKSAAVHEMRRVVAPGGRLGLSVFAPGPYDQALRKALSRHIEPDEKDFAIWGWGNPDWLRTLVEQAGLEISSLKKESIPSRYASLRQSVELMKDWSKAVAGLTGDMFEQVCMDMESELSDYITAEGFACPEPVIIVTARAQ
jgi:SAM-dependent methyltransferase